MISNSSGKGVRHDAFPANARTPGLILAGPNGSGKTTFAREFLPAEGNCPTFINADLIAEGLSPFHPESMAVEASRLMLEHVRQMVANFHQYYRNTVDAWQVFDASHSTISRWSSGAMAQ